MQKNFYLSLILAVVFSGCNNNKFQKEEKPINVTVIKPFNKTFEHSLEYNGIVQSPKIIQIKNRTDGFIEKQFFKDGSFVDKGDKLYKLDTKPLESDLALNQAQLKQAKAEYNNLLKIKQKTDEAFKIGTASKQEKETAETNLEKSLANIEMIQAAINKIKLNINYSTIIAPSSGFIEQSKYFEGAFVNSGTSFLTNIYTTDNLYFSVMIPIEKKSTESEILINEDKFKGILSFCEPKTDESTGLVKCNYIFTPNKKIEIGALGKITFKTKETGLFVPQTAIVQSSEGKSVFVAKDGEAIIKKIETGQWNEKDIEIKSGLTKEDEVIINGISNLRNKAKITKG